MSYLVNDVYGMYKCDSPDGICFMGAKTIIGEEVIGKNGKKLGKIEELMIDMRTQHVAYALMTFGGFLGMGERLFAVPFRAFHNDGIKGHLFLDVDEDSINNAPYIEKDNWPDMADKNWIREIHAFYGVEPYQVGM